MSDDVNHLIFAPGAWFCERCGFTLQKNVISATTGQIAANPEPFSVECPNDGQLMKPVTWKKLSEDNYKAGCEALEREQKLIQERDALNTLKFELRKWLDSQEITPDNIGAIRARLVMPWDSAWNALVRDETAAREKPNDIWQDPHVKAALKEGRPADDIAVLSCPKCGRYGYYNQGSHFYCRFCKEGWYCCTEGEEAPGDRQYIYLDGCTTLADTVTETTDGYHNETQPNIKHEDHKT